MRELPVNMALLRRIPIFANLSDDELKGILASPRNRIMDFGPMEEIIREGTVIEVEHVADLIARGFRHVEVRFDGDPPSTLGQIEGVTELAVAGSAVRCTVVGPIDPLLKELARHRVVDLVSEKPTLEEVFLTFYGESA